MTSSLKNLAIKGSAWTILGYGSSQILRFAGNLILTRLLIPEYFGLMAIVNTISLGLNLFSDIGIIQNIVRSERGDEPVFLNTAWTINILRGIIVWIVFMLLAWPIAHFYNEPILFPVILVMSITALTGGLISTRLFTLNRHMSLGKITLLDLSSQSIAIGTMITIAFFFPSVWAMVIGGVLGEVFKTTASYFIVSGPKHQFIIQPQARKEIFSFGSWLVLSSTIAFAADQSDRLILGKLIPLDFLGVYSIAYVFANLPQQIMRQLSFKVIFPLVSKQINLPRAELKSRINRQRWKLHALLLLIIISLAGFGDLLIQFLYDSRYQQAAWMMPILSLGSWFSVLFFTVNPCILALGKSAYTAQSKFLRFLVVSIGLLIGYKISGLLGAIIVISLGDLPAYISIQYALCKEGIGCVWQDFRSTVILFLLVGGVFMARIHFGLGSPLSTLS